MNQYAIQRRLERVMNHASYRYLERYGKRLTVQMYNEFISLIKSGHSIPLHRHGDRVVHDVNGVILVYRKRKAEIITFLPQDSREELEQNKTYQKYLDAVEKGLLRRDLETITMYDKECLNAKQSTAPTAS